MGRLTTDKEVDKMSMVELAHNSCYAEKHKAMYRDFETIRDARYFTRELYEKYVKEILPTDDDEFDERMIDDLQYEPTNHINGLIALFYRNLWAMADLREKLKAYEDIIDEPEKLLIVDKFLLEKCEEINELNKELAEYKKLEEEGLLLRLPCNVGDTVYRINRGAKNPIIAMVVTEVTFKALISGKVIMKVSCSDDVMPKINGLSVYYEEEIGKKIFLTQEEAEQALERMKEVQDKCL